MKILEVGGVTVRIFESSAGECVQFVAGASIDGDGGPNLFNDPCWQPKTSLTLRGKPINSLEVPFVVLPPIIIRACKNIVLGSFAEVLLLSKDAATRYTRGEFIGTQKPDVVCGIYGVVADVGPRHRIGEISIAAAKELGIPHSSLNGGISANRLLYSIWPGRPACIRVGGDIVTYSLQRFKR